MIEATAVFSGALSPINGVWPDLNYLGGRSSPALNTASAPFVALKDALGKKEAFEVCETAGFQKELFCQTVAEFLRLVCLKRSKKKQTNNNKNKAKPGSMCAVAALGVNKDAVAVLLMGKLLVIDHQYRENKQHG